jgi:hypothetical protein
MVNIPSPTPWERGNGHVRTMVSTKKPLLLDLMNHRLTLKVVDVDVLSNSFKSGDLQQVLLGIEQVANRELQSVQDVAHLQRRMKLLNLRMYS